jgi:hypothetical protein
VIGKFFGFGTVNVLETASEALTHESCLVHSAQRPIVGTVLPMHADAEVLMKIPDKSIAVTAFRPDARDFSCKFSASSDMFEFIFRFAMVTGRDKFHSS